MSFPCPFPLLWPFFCELNFFFLAIFHGCLCACMQLSLIYRCFMDRLSLFILKIKLALTCAENQHCVCNSRVERDTSWLAELNGKQSGDPHIYLYSDTISPHFLFLPRMLRIRFSFVEDHLKKNFIRYHQIYKSSHVFIF